MSAENGSSEHIAEDRENEFVIYASDLSEFCFCPRAWYIKNVENIRVETEEMKRGSKEHENALSLAVRAERSGKAARWILILAMLMLVAGLWILLF